MNILLNKNNINLNDAITSGMTFPVSAYNKRFHPVMNYASYIRRNHSEDKTITFERAGIFKYLVIAVGFPWSFYKNGTVMRATITLQENVGGTWVDRSQATVQSDDYFEASKKVSFQGVVLLEFPEYPIDTDSDKWRFHYFNERLSGNDTGYFYFWRPFSSGNFSDTIFIIPFLKEEEVYDPASDILVNFGQMLNDDNLTLEGVPTTGYGFYATGAPAGRVAIINGATKLNEPHPKLITQPKAGLMNMEVKGGGYIFLQGSNDKEEASWEIINNTDFNQKLSIQNYNGSSSWRGLYATIYSTNYNGYGGLKIKGLKGTDYKAIMSEAHHKNDTEIKLSGDFSSWQVDDWIMTTFPRERTTRMYRDYERQETRQITSVNYDAGTNVTTIGIDSPLLYEYDYQNYIDYEGITIDPNEIPYYVINTSRVANTTIEGSGYTKTTDNGKKIDLYGYIKTLHLESEGAVWRDFYRMHFYSEGYGNSRAKHGISFVKDGGVSNTYQFLAGYSAHDFEVSGMTAFKDTHNGVGYLSIFSKSNRVKIKNNEALRVTYLAQVVGSGWEIDGNIVEGSSFLNHYGVGTKITNNIIRNINSGILVQRSADFYAENNIYGKSNYLSTYNTNSGYYSGIYNIYDDAVGKAKVYNDKVYFAHSYVLCREDKGAKMYFKNSRVDKTIASNPKVHIDTTLNIKNDVWTTGTAFTFENFNNDGINEAFRHEGHEIKTVDSTFGTTWTLKSYDIETEMFYRKYRAVGVAGKSLTAKVLIKLSPDFLTGFHTLPVLRFNGLGMTQEVQAKPTSEWQYLTLTDVPNDTGQVMIEMTFLNESGDVQIASIYPFVDDPVATAELDITSDGLAYEEIFSEKLSAGQILRAPMGIDYGAGSFGDVVNKTNTQTQHNHEHLLVIDQNTQFNQ